MQFSGLVLKINLDQLVRELLFRQDNPSPVCIGSRMGGVKFHNYLRTVLVAFVLLPLFRPDIQPVSQPVTYEIQS